MIFECQIASPAFLIRKKILGANHGGAGLSPPPRPAVTPKIFTLCTSKGGGKSESRPGRHKLTLRHCIAYHRTFKKIMETHRIV